MMRVTVCEMPDNRKAFETAWEELIAYVRKQQSELVLLPELPFYPWISDNATVRCPGLADGSTGT